MVRWYTHEKIFRSLNFEFEIEARSPLRIGAGRARNPFSPVDLPVVTVKKDGVPIPYIPGSSLKGVFRSFSEYIALSKGIDNVCYIGEGCRSKYDRVLQEALKKNDSDIIANVLKEYCLICKIFGSASYLSHIFFEDVYPIGQVTRAVKTGIGISRPEGAVRRGALWTVEFIEPGSKFIGSIVMNNLPNYAVGIVSTVIDYIKSGLIKIGGFKTRGFGTVEFRINSVKGYIIKDHDLIDIKDDEVELPALDEWDVAVKLDPKDPGGYLNECRQAFERFQK